MAHNCDKCKTLTQTVKKAYKTNITKNVNQCQALLIVAYNYLLPKELLVDSGVVQS